jgi:hypothetical protein
MLNETNVTLALLTENTISKIVVPTASIFVSGYVAYMSMKYNARNIFIDANKEKINDAIMKLAEKAKRGKVDEINEILNSDSGIYIPHSLNKKIKREIKKETSSNLFYKSLRKKDELLRYFKKEEEPSLGNRILNLINKYISP